MTRYSLLKTILALAYFLHHYFGFGKIPSGYYGIFYEYDSNGKKFKYVLFWNFD